MKLALTAHSAAILAKSGGGITLDPIAKPIAAVLAFFYGLVPNYGVAIILLTVAVMIILTPLTIKQTRSMLVMQKLQPEMKRLQEEHKNDRQALNEAVMALYKEHNASPLGGCLPMLLPFPVFFALFRVLEGLSRTVPPVDPAIGHKVPWPKYLTSNTKMFKDIVHQGGTLKAFGMDLSKSALSVKGSVLSTLPFFLLLLLMVGTQYYQQRQLTSRNPQAANQQQAQIMKFFPILFGVISIRFPAGVVVYWTVSNIIRIFQQWAMYRYDPKVIALVEKDVKEVEARTREIDAKPTRPRFRDLLSGAAGAAPTDPKGAKAGPGKSTGRPNGKAGTPASGRSPAGGKAPAAGGKASPAKGKASPPAKSTSTDAKSTPSNPKSGPPGAKSTSSGSKSAVPGSKGKGSPAAKPAPATKAPAEVNDAPPEINDARPADVPTSNGAGKAGTGGSNGATKTPTGADDVGGGADVAGRVDGGSARTGARGPRTGAGSARTGAGGARTSGNRGKRTRRGR